MKGVPANFSEVSACGDDPHHNPASGSPAAEVPADMRLTPNQFELLDVLNFSLQEPKTPIWSTGLLIGALQGKS